MSDYDYDHHHGVQKLCPCPRLRWAKCPHSWYLRWTPPGQTRLQIKIDQYAGKHIELKSDALDLIIQIKSAVKAKTFVLPSAKPAVTPHDAAPAVDAPMTIRRLGALYFPTAKNRRTGRPLAPHEATNWQTLIATTITRPSNQAVTAIGDIPAASLTSFDIEAFRAVYGVKREVAITDVRGKQYQALRGGTRATNRIVGRWRAIYTWAVKTGHLAETPFLKGGVPIIERFGEQGRDRRLEEGELAKLLAVAPQNMQDLIAVAIDTAARRGELLSLRWYQVRWETGTIALDGKQTKNGKPRNLPILGTVRTVLERRRIDPTTITPTEPEGQPYPPMTFVFGDVTGSKLKDIQTAWTTIRLKAAGFTGQLRNVTGAGLTPAARQALRSYDLHFHDLRREGASSFLDDGMDLRAIQVFLDHANIATTSRYLRLGQHGLLGEAARLETRRAAKLVRIGKAGGNASATAAGSGEAEDRKLKAV